jgi:hypothetical protein
MSVDASWGTYILQSISLPPVQSRRTETNFSEQAKSKEKKREKEEIKKRRVK